MTYLIDLHTFGFFTWTNRRLDFLQIMERLDRFLFSQEWRAHNYSLQVHILPLTGSDHFPILVSIEKKVAILKHNLRPSFKFERMWFRHPHFHALVRQWWVSAPVVRSTKIFKFHKKMQFVKTQIKTWNKGVFKNIFSQNELVKN